MAFSWIELARVVHVLAAVVWVGGAIFGAVIVGPAVKAAGEAGRRFMEVVGRRGGPARLLGPASLVAVATGALVYWQDGYWREPFSTVSTAAVTIGGALGILVVVLGYTVGLPMQKKMAAVAAQIGPG